MLGKIAKFLFGSANDRALKPLFAQVELINKLASEYQELSDHDLQKKTQEFKNRIIAGENLDNLLTEAFATVREASTRVLKMRHFDVQLAGGINLHKGNITEMGTGEGKTLVATLPAYLNALTEKGVHIVTVNDYLAKRDSNWMGELYKFLGLTVSCITNDMDGSDRKKAYEADIVYGTNNEFGFDYLRDNMRFSIDEVVQKKFNFAIIDEVDSILIDEARTPLVISGPTQNNTDLYKIINKFIHNIKEDDYEVDEKSKIVTFNDKGNENLEKLLVECGLIQEEANLFDAENMHLVHHANLALKAHVLFKKEVDYIVKNQQIMIIDEFTGRALEGRRYAEGLHQALEAKESLPIQNENQTLASITFQNYFRLYPKISGMTGTGMTEAEEFADIYKLNVLEIPTNKIRIRKDADDEIYRTNVEKYEAIINQIEECYNKSQPVLVGTVSIEKSEILSAILKKKKIPHNVLNAKYHAKEAHIIGQAGRPSAVTIATNMAGRGTDIKLGGNVDMMVASLHANLKGQEKQQKINELKAQVENDKQKVIDAGGLFVLGTERHESRRIDNQLRGRSGRQGDPGTSKFYLSLEDDLMRIFASEKMSGILQKLGLKEGEAIYHPMISRALEKAQQKVEGRNYEIRKSLLRFDDVANDQRKIIYKQRTTILESKNVSNQIVEMRRDVNEEMINNYIPIDTYPEKWDIASLKKDLLRVYGMEVDIEKWLEIEGITDKLLLEKIDEVTDNLFEQKEQEYSADIMRVAEKRIYLITLDQMWKDHLHSLDVLRQGISLRAYGQKDPLNEYKKESFDYFQQMLKLIKEHVILRLSHVKLNVFKSPDGEVLINNFNNESNLDESKHLRTLNHDMSGDMLKDKIGRNEKCPCNSGKKFKHCHGSLK